MDKCQPDRTWRDQWEHDGNDQTTQKILTVFRRLWTPCRKLKTVGLDTQFLAFKGHHSGDGAQAANQVKMTQFLKFTHSIRVPFAIAADFNMEPDQLWETGRVQGLGQKASIVVPEVH